jgi:hypothetical protein
MTAPDIEINLSVIFSLKLSAAKKSSNPDWLCSLPTTNKVFQMFHVEQRRMAYSKA